MKILMIVTLVTPDNSYGGPVRVAVNQARALMDRGHDVVVAGGSLGYSSPPTTFDGVPLRLFPGRRVLPARTGFAGLSAPGLQRWLRATIDSFDVIHIHAARDFVTLPAARLARRKGRRYFLQTHGMIAPSTHPLSLPLDIGWTRSTLRSATGIFYLTDEERRARLEPVAGTTLPMTELPNGVPEYPASDPAEPPEVLFLGRLHAVKRPAEFVRSAIDLAAEFPDVRFTLVGPEEGEGAQVERLIQSSGMPHRIRWEGSIAPSDAPTRLGRSSVYVLPSAKDAYPMTVLEAMSSGVPVVVTEGCGLAEAIRSSHSGAVCDLTQEGLTDAVAQLLRHPDAAREMGRNGARLARQRYSMKAVAARLESAYAD